MTFVVDLRPDEADYLGSIRCAACGHLMALHNDHCCEFCMVTGCPCEWGEMPEEDP